MELVKDQRAAVRSIGAGEREGCPHAIAGLDWYCIARANADLGGVAHKLRLLSTMGTLPGWTRPSKGRTRMARQIYDRIDQSQFLRQIVFLPVQGIIGDTANVGILEP